MQIKSAENLNVSYKDFVQAHSALVQQRLGTLSPEAKEFQEKNFAVIDKVIRCWVLDLVEEVVRARDEVPKGKVNPLGRPKRQPLFKYLVKNKTTKDENRRMIDCGADWILYSLVAFPVTRKLEPHGFLMTADVSKARKAKVVAYVESMVGNSPDEPREFRDQSWHTDFDCTLASFFGMEFGISGLVGATQGSEIHVMTHTTGLETPHERKKLALNGHVEKVVLERGSMLLMGPGLRHKGVGYDQRNVRLFLAFLVGKSCKASFGDTYSLDDVTGEKFFVRVVKRYFKWLTSGPRRE